MNKDEYIFCPNCNKNIHAIKSQKLKTFPRILIFMLKKFEIDNITHKKLKINDHYEFPQELDMSQYLMDEIKVKKGENNDNNKFILKSVIAHTGNYNNGHYYALIRKENDKWYKFNDTEVSVFNNSLLEKEIFRNACLLFYEKKIKTIARNLIILNLLIYF